ncbi:hypothetical protein BO71DRAFT_431456 [Aspergillus ellipticus CBS 707.79]|uniref:Uncharacterized protein n=1 Tax=Aspergillus ellipticus CBS 707.79 TaxID=1448320 RepID=A0A319D6K3_9EURO|nr:hypothetical protein BO71DRAFT_431456 [Aspergillus ellipticus CBS 707.79]
MAIASCTMVRGAYKVPVEPSQRHPAILERQMEGDSTAEAGSPKSPSSSRRLRLAYDACHSAKIRCSGGGPCTNHLECRYSFTAKLGKPKGSRNKKTLTKPNARACTGRSSGSLARLEPVSPPSHQGMSADPNPSTTAFTIGPDHLTKPLEDEVDWTHADLFLDFDIPIDQHISSPGPPMNGDTLTAFGPTEPVTSATPPSPKGAAVFIHQTGFDMNDQSHNPVPDVLGSPLPEVTSHQTPPSPLHEKGTVNNPTFAFDPMVDAILNTEARGETSCECLRLFTNHLCLLNCIERKHRRISTDIILSRAYVILRCAESVLACPFCRLDGTALQLIVTIVQTIFHWIKMDYCSESELHPIPPIYFGGWKVSDEESHWVNLLLTKRILGMSSAVVDILRPQMEEICLLAKKQVKYQFMDTDTFHHAIERLSASVRDLVRLVKRGEANHVLR